MATRSEGEQMRGATSTVVRTRRGQGSVARQWEAYWPESGEAVRCDSCHETAVFALMERGAWALPKLIQVACRKCKERLEAA